MRRSSLVNSINNERTSESHAIFTIIIEQLLVESLNEKFFTAKGEFHDQSSLSPQFTTAKFQFFDLQNFKRENVVRKTSGARVGKKLPLCKYICITSK